MMQTLTIEEPLLTLVCFLSVVGLLIGAAYH